jgi:hypothetical protein
LITNTGRTILAKYLIGQAPAYASHLALGVGTTPLGEFDSFDKSSYAVKNNLTFEVLRIPINSRGYVYDEAGVANIVFAGELPGDQRYLFTEIGVFSARSNPAAGAQDSKMIYTFSESENWEYHDRTRATGIPTIVEPLNGNLDGSIINPGTDILDREIIAFRTNSNNTIFNTDVRADVYELPRFLDRVLMLSGNMSFIEEYDGLLSIRPTEADTDAGYFGEHIHLTGVRPNFNRNSAEDELRLAFSVLDKEAGQTAGVGGVRIIIEFASSDSLNPENFARFEVSLENGSVIDGISNDGLISADAVDFTSNRYFIVKKTFGDLIKSTAFTWNTVNSVKIYAMVYDTSESGLPSEDFYIALDGLRLENVTSQNPLYGMTGYSVVKTENAQPIVKEPNTSNIVEFRYGMDVA